MLPQMVKLTTSLTSALVQWSWRSRLPEDGSSQLDRWLEQPALETDWTATGQDKVTSHVTDTKVAEKQV